MSSRVLIVIHGDEPAGWVNEACHAVSMLRRPIVRVLAIAGLAFLIELKALNGRERLKGYEIHSVIQY